MSLANLNEPEFHLHIVDVFGYADRVSTGQRSACELEKSAIQRFYKDLGKQDDPDYPYRFDQDKAVRVINFVELLPHVKGKWAAKRELIRLQPWQKFILANIFGWVNKQTGFRKHRKIYVCVPRKNGKSIIAAAIALYTLTADNEYGAEIYCGATTEKQAWEVFRPAKQMAEKSPNFRKAFGVQVNAKSLEARNNSRFEPVIGKPGDGASPSCAIVDEYHEHPKSELYDTMDTGMGAREQGLMLVITTAGSNVSGPCYDLQKDVERLLTGVLDNDEIFGVIYGIDKGDDWTDPAVLEKANPNIDISVSKDFLIAAQKYATQNSSKQNTFKTKHLNVWCWAKSAYFNSIKWLELADSTLNKDDFKQDDCFISLDLAKIWDLSAKVDVFRRYVDGQIHYYVFTTAWLPMDSILDDQYPQNKELYGRWFNDGHLKSGGDSEMDLRIISDEVIAQRDDGFNIVEVPHDPHLGFLIARDLSEAGLVPVQINQHGTFLGPGMRELEAAIAAGRVHHDNNPVMNWNISNVTSREYSNGGLMPDKDSKENKIDCAVALIMAVSRAVLGEAPEQVHIFDPWAHV